MNNFRKAAAGVLCVGTILSMCSCSESAVQTSADLPISSASYDVGDVEKTAYAAETGVELETPMLQHLGTYDITKQANIQPLLQLYEQTYASQYYNEALDAYIYPDGSDTPIKCQTVSSAQLLDTLMERKQSDDLPDLVDKLDNTYPYLMSKNIFEDLTSYMDMSAPQWVELQEYIDRYEYNGKHYYYPWSYNVSPQFLLYNRTLLEDYGISDPAEQWKNDEWTWDTFLDACQKFVYSSGGTTVGVYGEYIADNFIASTGTMLIGVDESGNLVNNFGSPAAVRAAEWLEANLRNTGLAADVYYDESVSDDPLVSGQAVFRAADIGVFDSYCTDNPDTDIFLVPFPRDPEAEDYYYMMSTFGYLVPKGAKNVQGACSFINSCRLGVINDNLRNSAMESFSVNKQYTAEEYDFLQQFRHPESFSVVIDENYCFDEELSADIQEMLTSIVYDRSEEQQSWSEMTEEHGADINAAIAEINALFE